MSDGVSEQGREESKHGWVAIVALGLPFVLTTVIFCALLGVLYVRFVMPPAADGWTGIANALGGLMIGAVLGLVIAVALCPFLLRRGGPRALGMAALAALGASVLLVVILRLAAPESSEDSPDRPISREVTPQTEPIPAPPPKPDPG